MKVFIPKHLRSIAIIDQLYNMIASYSSDTSWNSGISGSFDDYQFSLKTDPVKKFLELCIPREVVAGISGNSYLLNSDTKTAYLLSDNDVTTQVEWSSDYDSIVDSERKDRINYLSAMFYSVKGTYRVFDFILGFEIFSTSRCNINYTTKSIQIYIDRIDVDRDLFCTSLESFLSALLYFEKLSITIGSSSTRLTQTIETSVNYGEMYYTYNKIKFNQ